MATASSSRAPEPEAFLTRQHILFALRCLKFLPTPYQAEDSNRMSLAYFCLSALALLPGAAASSADADGEASALEVMLKPKAKSGYADWVYAQQLGSGGFRGSDSMEGTASDPRAGTTALDAIPLNDEEAEEFARLMAFPDDVDDLPPRGAEESPLSPAHLIQSYTALLVLALLSDDFTRLDRQALLRFVARCQNDDGSFSQFPGCAEPGDSRSTYSAFAISSILNDWSAVGVDSALEFLKTCQRPEGGFATRPGLEPQGGTTYCAIASFSLASRIASIPRPEAVLRWLVDRQTTPPERVVIEDDSDSDAEDVVAAEQLAEEVAGFQGRIGKDTDACYSFWCTASIKLLRPHLDILRPELDRRWLHSCQHPAYGGIAREPGAYPDVYHTYLSLAALSLGGEPGLEPLDAAWNVSTKVAERIRRNMGRGQ